MYNVCVHKVFLPCSICRYAIVMFTSLNLQGNLVNGDLSLVSVTDFYPDVSLPQNPGTIIRTNLLLDDDFKKIFLFFVPCLSITLAVIGAAAGATLVFVFIIIFIISIVYWRRFMINVSM